MCGIVGYVGPRPVADVLLDGLERLEYRGYDSAGLALGRSGALGVFKTDGRLRDLREMVDASGANVGAGHTRWATHGRPSILNAHPHLDCHGQVAVVHNGIIENYVQLREELTDQGHRFLSETDTEVIPHLVEEYYQGDLPEAVARALQDVQGSLAIVVLHAEHPDMLVVARRDSPLIIGLGQGENYVASDIPALLPYTRDVHVMENGEMAVLTQEGVKLTDWSGREIKMNPYRVNWDPAQAEKEGYEHFMLKEIHEQPRAIEDTLKGKIKGSQVVFDSLDLPVDRFNKIVILGCGTAWHAGLMGRKYIEALAKIPVEVDIASEFRYRDPMVDEGTLTIVISQSGETADTLGAMREAQRRGSRILAITNVVGSTVSREADDVIYTRAGPEIAVASTKAYMTQLVCLLLLALYLAQRRGAVDEGAAAEVLDALRGLPDQVREALKTNGKVEDLAQRLQKEQHVFFIGRGLDYPLAMEAALKLKEVSYIHAQPYPAGEMKHGTLALVVEGLPIVAIATQSALREKMLNNIKEVKARGADVVVIAPEGDDLDEVGEAVHIPRTMDLLMPLLSAVPCQLLAYHTARIKGCDVDKPRNLAKSVTVE
ncbi:MAG: glutamine--fructose-6-phosphate transaminase (isomerizing) [Firmicutes bacterium]|jgi:glucosamine--fructose-6-phosphate aminotransferase (isomerizing)|nr:glutamine--fructose-6-phosphate transaminase (isomerizing) [Bacillota bacterium]